jgi:hypothetical protein
MNASMKLETIFIVENLKLWYEYLYTETAMIPGQHFVQLIAIDDVI